MPGGTQATPWRSCGGSRSNSTPGTPPTPAGLWGGSYAMPQSLPVVDERRPPSEELIADCVHCGFCLPTCPTYALWGEEMDSPRGRIYLMKLGLDGAAELNETYVGHFDKCLGCMACLTSCPSGVQYEKL